MICPISWPQTIKSVERCRVLLPYQVDVKTGTTSLIIHEAHNERNRDLQPLLRTFWLTHCPCHRSSFLCMLCDARTHIERLTFEHLSPRTLSPNRTFFLCSTSLVWHTRSCSLRLHLGVRFTCILAASAFGDISPLSLSIVFPPVFLGTALAVDNLVDYLFLCAC